MAFPLYLEELDEASLEQLTRGSSSTSGDRARSQVESLEAQLMPQQRGGGRPRQKSSNLSRESSQSLTNSASSGSTDSRSAQLELQMSLTRGGSGGGGSSGGGTPTSAMRGGSVGTDGSPGRQRLRPQEKMDMVDHLATHVGSLGAMGGKPAQAIASARQYRLLREHFDGSPTDRSPQQRKYTSNPPGACVFLISPRQIDCGYRA